MRRMRRVLLLLPLLALAGCKKEPAQGAVKVTVTYQGFKPGCVRVTARDAQGAGEPLSTEVAGKGEPTGGSLVIAVFPKDDWGSSVEVEGQAFERSCTGTPVVSNSQRVTVVQGEAVPATLTLSATDRDQDGYVSRLTGGTDCNDDVSAINPGVTDERCNDVDDNCNGKSDRDELGLGQTCTNAQNCQGTTQCGARGATVCVVTTGTTAYPDGDGDGRGRKDAEPTVFCNGVPTGYTTGPADDCDDTNPNVHPSAAERCNNADDNCNGTLDEVFPVAGSACSDSATQCSGQYACDTVTGQSVCQVTQARTDWYLDADGDTYGSGTAVPACVSPGAGYASRADDCDDGNPFRHPNRTEVCDGLDNNCDNDVEAAALCPSGGPTFEQRTVGASTLIWQSVYTSASGEVGAAAHVDARARLLSGSNTFQETTAGCDPTNSGWNTLWIDEANNGRGYFGSAGGRLVYQDRTSSNCASQLDIDRPVESLVGIRNGASLELHGVTSPPPRELNGTTFIWNGGGSLTYGTTGVSPLYDVHGVSRTALFAVGGYDPGSGVTPGPRIYRFNAMDGQWATENAQSISGLARLNGVWVVNEKVAFAVGEANSALRWDGTGWSKLAFPNTFTESLRSVVAFGANLAYAAAYNGRIYRYNGQQWTQIFQDTSLKFTDIAGTGPDDLWVVGENGVILHYPQWPQ
jgi:hypothetical protein